MDQPAAKSMVANCAAYGADGRKLRDITLDEISDFLAQPDGFVWVGLVEPDEALLEKMQEEFNLHELAVGTRIPRTSGPRSRATAIRCSSWCRPRRSPTATSRSEKPTSS